MIKPKAKAACLEQEGVGRRETTDCSSRYSWMKPKAKAARSECEGDGASDVEALFAS
ncbi:conserved hypothetical protein [Bacillus cereus B4264]|uniref:Uncharacterized protein n=1 Tax=Bacillus cereus (strain B4264) TaxID=405532 RepID=B7HBB1_BACC4|nr:conserved hypothetical protein [Bacillus cereus B4264]